MYVIDVIPLTPLPPQTPQIVSYFFDRQLPKGAVVHVPFGNREIPAAVIDASPLEGQKIALKKSGFELKRITSVVAEEPCISNRQFKIAAWLAKRYAAALGMCLKATLMPSFGTKRSLRPITDAPGSPDHSATPVSNVIISGSAERTAKELESIVERYVRAGKQVLVVVPEVSTATVFVRRLARWTPRSYHAELGRTELVATWQAAADTSSLVFIGTRAALFLPLVHLGAIIVEDRDNDAYKSDMSPRYVAPDLAAYCAGLSGAELFSTTPSHSVADEHALREHQATLNDHTKRLTFDLVDMAQEFRNGPSPLFSRLLADRICDAVDSKHAVLLYSARKAYSGVLVCRNCGGLAKCKNCDIPLRVHRIGQSLALQPRESMLVCYHCSAYHAMPDRCGNCSSTALAPSGIPGSQRIEEELRTLLTRRGITTPEIFVLDSDLIRDRVQEEEVLERIAAVQAPIVIATQKVLSYRYTHRFPLVAVMNADALATSNDFRTDERLVYQLSALADFKPEQYIIQSFRTDSPVLRFLRGERTKFYDDELVARRAFRYPPYARIALLTYAHLDRDQAAHNARLVGEQLRLIIARLGADDMVVISGPSPAMLAKVGGFYQQTILLKLALDFDRLDSIVRGLPPGWKMDIDPRSTV